MRVAVIRHGASNYTETWCARYIIAAKEKRYIAYDLFLSVLSPA